MPIYFARSPTSIFQATKFMAYASPGQPMSQARCSGQCVWCLGPRPDILRRGGSHLMRSSWLRITGCLIAALLFMMARGAHASFHNDAPPPLLPGGTWDLWLDRAREEIAALLGAPVEPKVVPIDIDLGVMLAADRLNNADKTMLQEMLKVAPQRAPVADESQSPLSAALCRSRLLWALGEQEKARAEFTRARSLAKDVKRTE